MPQRAVPLVCFRTLRAWRARFNPRPQHQILEEVYPRHVLEAMTRDKRRTSLIGGLGQGRSAGSLTAQHGPTGAAPALRANGGAPRSRPGLAAAPRAVSTPPSAHRCATQHAARSTQHSARVLTSARSPPPTAALAAAVAAAAAAAAAAGASDPALLASPGPSGPFHIDSPATAVSAGLTSGTASGAAGTPWDAPPPATTVAPRARSGVPWDLPPAADARQRPSSSQHSPSPSSSQHVAASGADRAAAGLDPAVGFVHERSSAPAASSLGRGREVPSPSPCNPSAQVTTRARPAPRLPTAPLLPTHVSSEVFPNVAKASLSGALTRLRRPPAHRPR